METEEATMKMGKGIITKHQMQVKIASAKQGSSKLKANVYHVD